MSKFYGFTPDSSTKQIVEQFENEVMIRHNNQILVGIVYGDMQNDRWAISIAYNLSRHPGLYGHEHGLEVRYSYRPRNGKIMTMLRLDPVEEIHLNAGPFPDPNSFARYALEYERNVVHQKT